MLFILYQVALITPFDWLVESQLLKEGWRSVSMECGEWCVMTAGTSEMPELCADS